MPNSDVGVVLYASWNGSGSFTGKDGNPGTVRTLTAANFIASDWFDVGRLADLFLTVAGVISAGMASAIVMIERRRADADNAFFHPSVMSTVRADSPGAGPAIQQTIVLADLVGQDVSAWPAVGPAVETLDVVLATTDQRWAGQCRVLVKASNAPQNGDKIIIAANGGG